MLVIGVPRGSTLQRALLSRDHRGRQLPSFRLEFPLAGPVVTGSVARLGSEGPTLVGLDPLGKACGLAQGWRGLQ